MDIRPGPGPQRVLVAADDLIWASRLRAAVERAGAVPVAGPGATLATALQGDPPRRAVVDLGLRGQDPVALITTLVVAGVAVIAVGQHDDLVARKRALAAGATRVYSYDKLFRDGPGVIGVWLDGMP